MITELHILPSLNGGFSASLDHPIVQFARLNLIRLVLVS